MATVTKINPEEIPEVSNKFLMRADSKRDTANMAGDEGDDRKHHRGEQRSREQQKGFGWSKKRVPVSRSGRIIKGRGNFVSFTCNRKLSVPPY